MVVCRAWLQRWVVSCQGDADWAARRIFAHLRWRQEYHVDNIMQEVARRPPPLSKPTVSVP
jgi:hypothetical protein